MRERKKSLWALVLGFEIFRFFVHNQRAPAFWMTMQSSRIERQSARMEPENSAGSKTVSYERVRTKAIQWKANNNNKNRAIALKIIKTSGIRIHCHFCFSLRANHHVPFLTNCLFYNSKHFRNIISLLRLFHAHNTFDEQKKHSGFLSFANEFQKVWTFERTTETERDV